MYFITIFSHFCVKKVPFLACFRENFSKKFHKNLGLLLTFGGIYRIIYSMEKRKLAIYITRALLITLTVLTLAFILRNGLASGEVSASESHSVTEAVQEVVGAIDPDSPIATATGEQFDLLHACVREAAHF